MYDAAYLGLSTFQVLSFLALAALAIWLLIRYFWSRSDGVAPSARPAPQIPVNRPAPAKAADFPKPATFAPGNTDELRTLRGQLDATILERLTLEGKLKDALAASAGSGTVQKEISDLKRESGDLTLQKNDLLKRLDTQQEEQMRTAGQLNEQIAALKRQLDQTPAPTLVADLNAKLKSLTDELQAKTLAYNDLSKRLDHGQEDQMHTAGRLNTEILALQAARDGLKRDNDGLAMQKTTLTDGLNKLVWEFVAPPIPHLAGSETADEQLNKLRFYMQNHKTGGADIEARATKLRNELASATSRAGGFESEISRLKMQIAQAPADHSGDVRRLTEQLARVTQERDAVRLQERALADKVRIVEHDLSQARGGMEELGRLSAERQDEIQRLKAQMAAMPNVDEYRRFKEALEAANRIASGQKL